MLSSATKWPDVGKLAGMMRIGKKYQLNNIFEEAMTRLKDQFPPTLASNDSTDFISTQFHEWMDEYFEDIICIGEEMALWSILPAAYYLEVSSYPSIVSPIKCRKHAKS